MLDVAPLAASETCVPSGADGIDAHASAIDRAEQRLRILEELTDIGMNIARAVERRALAEATTAEAGDTKKAKAPSVAAHGDPAHAFARVSRAVRLTLALTAKVEEELRSLRAGELVAREARRREAAERVAAAKTARREKVNGIVTDLLFEEVQDMDEIEAVDAALEERLTDDEAYADLADRPLREIVESLCADLCLTPDWSRWTGEGWTRDENGRFRNSRYATRSRRPVNRIWPPPPPPRWE